MKPHHKISESTPAMRWGAIAALVASITLAHALIGRASHEEHVVHVALRAAFLIPILLGAVWYGAPGAAAVAGATSAILLIHIRTAWLGDSWENANQLAMIAVYWVTGLMTGVLITLERRADSLRREAEERLQREVLVSGLGALEAALKSRDEYTGTHGEAVAVLAASVARELRLSEDRVELVHLAGLVHDLGKIAVRDDVLYKPEALTPQELEAMRRHPRIAADILATVPGSRKIAEIVRAHHEYLDGSGYPDGLRGPAIPIETRIVTVADIFCAVTDDRAYHRGMSVTEALALLDGWVPNRVSAKVVAALRTCVATPSAHLPLARQQIPGT
ncbi:MAG: HD-GYP domain-containing protein [Myxococcota bacterium]